MSRDSGWKPFASRLSSLLEKVLAGDTEWRELQALVDHAITRDELPEDLPEELRRHIYDLQTDLEMLSIAREKAAEKQTHLTGEEINGVLRKYKDLMRATRL